MSTYLPISSLCTGIAIMNETYDEGLAMPPVRDSPPAADELKTSAKNALKPTFVAYDLDKDGEDDDLVDPRSRRRALKSSFVVYDIETDMEVASSKAIGKNRLARSLSAFISFIDEDDVVQPCDDVSISPSSSSSSTERKKEPDCSSADFQVDPVTSKLPPKPQLSKSSFRARAISSAAASFQRKFSFHSPDRRRRPRLQRQARTEDDGEQQHGRRGSESKLFRSFSTREVRHFVQRNFGEGLAQQKLSSSRIFKKLNAARRGSSSGESPSGLKRSWSAREVRQFFIPKKTSHPGKDETDPSSGKAQGFNRLRRTLTVSSMVNNLNRSFRSKTQSFRNLAASSSSSSHPAKKLQRPSAPLLNRLSASELVLLKPPKGQKFPEAAKDQSEAGVTRRLRSRELADIDPKFTSQSGLCSSSELETSRGASIRIQHLTAASSASLANLETSHKSSSTMVLRDRSASTSGTRTKREQDRFPRLQSCAHFHYDFTELPSDLNFHLLNTITLNGGGNPTNGGNASNAASNRKAVIISTSAHNSPKLIKRATSTTSTNENSSSAAVFNVQVTSNGRAWVLRRSWDDFVSLDRQVHSCVFDRRFSKLPQIEAAGFNKDPHEETFTIFGNVEAEKENLPLNEQDSVRHLLSTYLLRLSHLSTPRNSQHVDTDGDVIINSGRKSTPGGVILCGPVLNWFELDNRGHRLILADDADINTPAVAAAYAVKRYQKQAPDEISFEVGDMISVIDMPPADESIWWRGKRGFDVGFFPMDCVEVINNANNGSANEANAPKDELDGSHGSSASTTSSSEASASSTSEPSKPVLRKHGKLISFFRSFILSRPSRGKLKKSGILKERVFGCDLSEHLMNTGLEVPRVLTHCAEFIEKRGIIDGIYRLSGIASNIQKLRVAFDEDRVPNLYDDRAVLQDIHSVSSLLKMYFRELPNPICTYHLYDKFVEAAKAPENTRLVLMRDVVQQLPPPNYRTLEYLSRHLYRVSLRGSDTGMTAKNVAIVWAPNLLRSKSLEVGGVAALQGVGVQAVVTEYLIRYCELIFSEKMPSFADKEKEQAANNESQLKQQHQMRPKSLAISTPAKLLSLEEARSRAAIELAKLNGASERPETLQPQQRYIEVGGGPKTLPSKYHTVIDLPSRRSGSGFAATRRSPMGWKNLFRTKNNSGGGSGNGKKTDEQQTTTKPSMAVSCLQRQNSASLRPVRSAESLSRMVNGEEVSAKPQAEVQPAQQQVPKVVENGASRPQSMDLDQVAPLELVQRAMGHLTADIRESPKCHSRSSSHDSYFERKLSYGSSMQFQMNTDDAHTPNSQLDLSEIQVNFDLEENEMKIFSEDEAMRSASLASDLSKAVSPLDEDGKAIVPPAALAHASGSKRSPKPPSDSDEGGSASPKSRKMSFKEKLKFRRFTSPTPNRRALDGEDGQGNKRTSIREKLATALSPESLRKKSILSESSPQKKKKLSRTSESSEQVKRSKIESDDYESGVEPLKSPLDNNPDNVATSNGLPLSPSINFIDATMTDSTEQPNDLTAKSETGPKVTFNFNRFSVASSTDSGVNASQQDQLVVAEVHPEPIKDQVVETSERAEGEEEKDSLGEQAREESEVEALPADQSLEPRAEPELALSADKSPTSDLSPSPQENPASSSQENPVADTADKDPVVMPSEAASPKEESVPSLDSAVSVEKGSNKTGSNLGSSMSYSPAGATVSENESFSLGESIEEVEEIPAHEEAPVDNSILPADQPSISKSNEVQEVGAPQHISPPKLDNAESVQEEDKPVEKVEECFKMEVDEETKPETSSESQVQDAGKEDSAYDTSVVSGVLPMQIDPPENPSDEADKGIVVTATPIMLPETAESSAVESDGDDEAADINTLQDQQKPSSVEMSAPIVYEAKTRTSTHLVRHCEPPRDPDTSDDTTVEGTYQSSRHISPILCGAPAPYAKPRESPVNSLPAEEAEDPPPKVELRHPAGRRRAPVPKPRTIHSIVAPENFNIETMEAEAGGSPATNPVPDRESEDAPLTLEEEEAKASSLPMYIDPPHDDGRKSALAASASQHKQISFASELPSVNKKICKSDTVLPNRLSTRDVRVAFETNCSGADMAKSEDAPLQRRNSIHNVPFVDVNDPQTRERMERYKEERRSMLRAKYKVEDYKTPSTLSSKAADPDSQQRKKSVSPTPAPRKTSLSPSAASRKKSTSPSARKSSPNTANPRKSAISVPQSRAKGKSPSPNRAPTSNGTPSLRKMPVSAPPAKKTSLPATGNAKRDEEPRKWSLPAKKTSSVGATTPKPKERANLTQSLNAPSSKRQSPSPTARNRTSYPVGKSSGLIEDDVNVRERAAKFGASSVKISQNGARKSLSNRTKPEAQCLAPAPVSPNKIKNMAALFEQKN